MDGKCMADLHYSLSACYQNGPTANLPFQPVMTPDHHSHQQVEKKRARAEHNRLKGEPPHMGKLGIHQNINAADTKLTASLGINFISPPLVVCKLVSINSRAITSPPKKCLLLEVEHTLAVIIQSRLILLIDFLVKFIDIVIFNNLFCLYTNQVY